MVGKRGRLPPWAKGSTLSKAQRKARRGMRMQAAAVAERLNLSDCDMATWAKTNRKNKRRKRTKVITADDGSFSVAAVGGDDEEGAEPEAAAASDSEVRTAEDDNLMSDEERGSSDSDDDYVCCGSWCHDEYKYPVQLVQDLRRYYYSLPEADRQEFIDQRKYLPEGRKSRTHRCMEPPEVLRRRLSVLWSPLGGFCGKMPPPADLGGRCNPVDVCTEYFR